MSHSMEYSCDHFVPAVLALRPPALLCTTSLLTGGEAEQDRENLNALCRLCSSCPDIVVNTVSAANLKLNTIWAALKRTNPIAARPSELYQVGSVVVSSVT